MLIFLMHRTPYPHWFEARNSRSASVWSAKLSILIYLIDRTLDQHLLKCRTLDHHPLDAQSSRSTIFDAQNIRSAISSTELSTSASLQHLGLDRHLFEAPNSLGLTSLMHKTLDLHIDALNSRSSSLKHRPLDPRLLDGQNSRSSSIWSTELSILT